jgi:hypothetical protein
MRPESFYTPSRRSGPSRDEEDADQDELRGTATVGLIEQRLAQLRCRVQHHWPCGLRAALC